MSATSSGSGVVMMVTGIPQEQRQNELYLNSEEQRTERKLDPRQDNCQITGKNNSCDCLGLGRDREVALWSGGGNSFG